MKNEQDRWECFDFSIAGVLRLKLEKDSPTDHPLILRVNMHDDGAVTFNAYPNHKERRAYLNTPRGTTMGYKTT